MNRTRTFSRLAKSLCMIAAVNTLAIFSSSAKAQLSTAFTYQGRLDTGGTPYTGNADFQFRLFDGPSLAAGQVAGTLTVPGVSVNDGVFTATLDFGASVFDGDDRWLGISVRAPSASFGQYTTLSPRQRLSAAPYALYALTAGNSSPFVLNGSNAVFSGGNVGIGTSTPQAGIHMLGFQPTIRLQHNVGNGFSEILEGSEQQLRINKQNNSGGVLMDLNPKPDDQTSAATVRFFRETNTTGPKAVQFLRGNFTTASSASIGVDGTDSWFQLHGGNLGIGTASPLRSLHVVSGSTVGVTPHSNSSAVFERSGPNYVTIISPDANERGLLFADPESFVNGGIIYNSNSVQDGFAFRTGGNANRMVITSTGNVGIGTNTPVHTFQVVGGGSIGVHGAGSPGVYGVANSATYYGGTFAGSGAFGSGRALFVAGDTHLVGNVGIGTTSPLAKLHVNGTTRTNVLQITGGADLAEAFDVLADDDVQVEPGMVVCIDPNNPGKLIPSTRAYDCTVAGVISGAGGVNSGMIMGQEGSLADGAHPVALTGRVYVMVDASLAAVVPGDLLTTSDVPGHAMKASDRERRDGAVIGKAMTGLAQGERGLVLVLISLQ